MKKLTEQKGKKFSLERNVSKVWILINEASKQNVGLGSELEKRQQGLFTQILWLWAL